MQRKPSRRSNRVSELIWHEVAKIFDNDISDPRLQTMTVTSVSLSSDLRRADVYFLISDQDDIAGVEKTLGRASGRVRKLLAQRCSLKYIPAISFHHDEVLLQADKIHSILSDVPDAEDEE